MPPKKAPVATKRAMSKAHKAALAQGREEGRAIRQYLEAIERNRPKRGRKRTKESINKRLRAIADRLPAADALSRVQLVQEQMDLEAELTSLSSTGPDLKALEAGFVKAAAPYGQRKGISYAAWRAAGVDVALLKRAGIGRGR